MGQKEVIKEYNSRVRVVVVMSRKMVTKIKYLFLERRAREILLQMKLCKIHH